MKLNELLRKHRDEIQSYVLALKRAEHAYKRYLESPNENNASILIDYLNNADRQLFEVQTTFGNVYDGIDNARLEVINLLSELKES